MAVAYTDKPLISLGTGTVAGATLPDIDYGGKSTNIMTIVIESENAQVGDLIEIQDADGDPVIPPVRVPVADDFFREILINNNRRGVNVKTNTGGRATVWVNRLALTL